MTDLFTPPTELCYEHLEWEAQRWQHHKENNQKIQNIVDCGTRRIYSFSTFSKEVFQRFVNDNNEMLKDAQIKPEKKWAYEFHKKLYKHPLFEGLKQKIKAASRSEYWKQYYLAAEATSVILSDLVDELPETDMLNDLQSLREEVKYLKQQNAPQENIDKVVSQGIKQKQEYEKIQDLISTDSLGKVDSLLEKATSVVSEMADNLDAISWGKDSNNNNNNSSTIEDKISLARQLQKDRHLLEIAKIAGRLKVAFTDGRKQKQKIEVIPDTVELGNNLKNILPTELLKLSDSNFKNYFNYQYVSYQLLQIVLKDNRPLNKGPIICCVDVSGSMNTTRERFAKAVALVLLNAALSEKRNFVLIFFDEKVRKCLEFKDWDASLITEMAKYFSGGGTDWMKPLNRSIEYLENNYFAADVVLITDGYCDYGDKWLENYQKKKTELNYQLLGILINAKVNDRFQQLCDRAFAINPEETESTSTMSSVFRELV